MTEADWHSSTDPAAMLAFFQQGGRASDRKLRLWACACVRRVWPLLPQGVTHEAVRLAEQFADGQATARDLGRVRKPGRNPFLHPSNFVALSLAPVLLPDLSAQAASEMAEAITRFVGWECRGGRPVEYVIHAEAVQAESQAQAALLHDLFGNPFRPPPALDRSLLTPSSIALARAAYEQRNTPEGTLDRGRLAALADALAAAGCTDAELIGHLRSRGPHVRGCFALDVLGVS